MSKKISDKNGYFNVIFSVKIQIIRKIRAKKF